MCAPQTAWADLDPEERARLKSRQGVAMIHAVTVRVVEHPSPGEQHLVDVPADGVTLGEVVMTGNGVMKGYFGDEEARASAFAGGWLHSGDLGVMHPDCYVQLLDRAKEIVVPGDENIATAAPSSPGIRYRRRWRSPRRCRGPRRVRCGRTRSATGCGRAGIRESTDSPSTPRRGRVTLLLSAGPNPVRPVRTDGPHPAPTPRRSTQAHAEHRRTDQAGSRHLLGAQALRR